MPVLKGLNFDEKDAFIIETTPRNDSIYGEDSLDVVPPLGVAVERLRGVVADAADAVAVDFGAERAGRSDCHIPGRWAFS